MTAHGLQIKNLNDLRTHVHETLCFQNQLEIGAFEMTERILFRGKRECGIYFCLHGPRSVKLVAIWESAGNRVLFYGSGGQRLERRHLRTPPGGVL